MIDKTCETAEEIRTIAATFGVVGDALVTFQKVGGPAVRLPLRELLERLEHPMPLTQMGLFDPKL